MNEEFIQYKKCKSTYNNVKCYRDYLKEQNLEDEWLLNTNNIDWLPYYKMIRFSGKSTRY